MGSLAHFGHAPSLLQNVPTLANDVTGDRSGGRQSAIRVGNIIGIHDRGSSCLSIWGRVGDGRNQTRIGINT
ncbi:hypothetical protein ASG67_08550 [Sphingomonas sp. Leaf339]|nr:hypothetical protein ASG67_08550 [Sphingomonas sp. Leaf339]